MSCAAELEHIGGMLSVGERWSDENDYSSGSHDSFDEVERELRVTAIHDPPYTEFHRLSNGSYRYDGYLFALWEIIAQELNLRYRIESPADGAFGNLDENGTWSGMVGELTYGRADVALAWVNMRPDRAEVVDYLDSQPVDTVRETFYIPKDLDEIPNFSEYIYRSLLKPLDSSVWWSLLASMFLLSIVLRFIMKANRRNSESSQTVKDMTWGSCLLAIVMTLVGQGWAKTPDSLAARTATISSWMLGLVIYTTYTTTLISFLTVDTVQRPISSLQEFSERSDWTLAVLPGHAVLNDWKESPNVHLRALVERSASGEGFLAINATPENIRKLVQPKVMIYASRTTLLNVIGNHTCRLVTLEDNAVYDVSRSFLAIAKGMPKLRTVVNDLLVRLHEIGVLSKLKNQWFFNSGENDACEEVDRALSFAETIPVMAVIVSGLMFSVLLLPLELGWAKLKEQYSVSQSCNLGLGVEWKI